MHCMHLGGYFACGENTHTLRLTSELVDLRVGKAPADSSSKARRATSLLAPQER